MRLDQATELITTCAERMNARYKKVVFDEWAILSLEPHRGHLLAYRGPRKEGFQRNFLADVGGLREGLLNKVEVAIRCFDPCLSCSTHALGQMPLIVELVPSIKRVRDASMLSVSPASTTMSRMVAS